MGDEVVKIARDFGPFDAPTTHGVGGRKYKMGSIRTAVVMVLSMVVAVASLTGCPEEDEAANAPVAVGVEEKTLLSRSCGQEGDHMIVAWTSEDAKKCGDTITINGTPVKGTSTYNEQDKRWSLSFLVPAGASTGEIRLACADDDIKLGAFTVPCPPTPESGNQFQTLEGHQLKVSGGCDDADGYVEIGGFTSDSFEMTGLGDNGTITFKVDGNKATAENVSQFGKSGHKVTLTLDNGQQIHLNASSPAGSCDATLRPATAGK